MAQLDDMLPLADAALLTGITAHTLKQQAERGRLQARKLAGRWLTTRQWLAEYLEAHARKNHQRNRAPVALAGSTAGEGAGCHAE